jgi:hypothetical protein
MDRSLKDGIWFDAEHLLDLEDNLAQMYCSFIYGFVLKYYVCYDS